MRLYSGSAKDFVDDALHNRVKDKLVTAYTDYYGHQPDYREALSWTNSLQFLKSLIEYSQVFDSNLVLEFEIPYSTRRIDCLLFGKGLKHENNVVLIELKQWDKVKASEIDGTVYTFVGGGERLVSHPSKQVMEYHEYLQDFVALFEETPEVALSSCVYCHNYPKNNASGLFDKKFEPYLERFPIFAKDDLEKLSDYLKLRLATGSGLELFNRFIVSEIKPSKKLIEHTKHMVEGQKVFHLIDEQLVANDTIIDRATKCSKLNKKLLCCVNN